MVRKRNIIIIVAWIILIILTYSFGHLYSLYTSVNGHPHISCVKDIDEHERYSRPYTYITSMSSSNISSVEDLYIPKYFNNDNITVYFPEGDRYGYGIAIRPEDPSGSLVIYRSNGSEFDHSRWESGAGSIGGGLYSELRRFEGGESLTLNFEGSGIVIFLSVSTSQMFGDSSDYSRIVKSGLVSFYLPTQLTWDLPPDRRIVAEASPINGSHFNVRYYDEGFHFLGEAKGTKNTKTQIPSGNSYMVFAVVESEGDISFRFSYSNPLPGETDLTQGCLFGGFLLSLISIFILAVKTVIILRDWKS